MWFYREAFRLFSILVFMLNWNIFIESSQEKYVSSIDNEDVDNIQEDNRENITDLPKTIIFVDQNGKMNYRRLSDLLNEDVYSVRVIKGPQKAKKEKALRGKYADACVKVAIRKCYKALLSVRNKLCKLAYRCKRDFKDDFKVAAKRAAIAEFDYSKYLPKMITDLKNKKEVAEFIHATRKKYIQLCVPLMIQGLKLKQRKAKHMYDTHIFRKGDPKSERECQIISANKCLIACSMVRRKLCSLYGCGSSKRKYFRKACTDICKREYRAKTDSESSDDEYLMI